MKTLFSTAAIVALIASPAFAGNNSNNNGPRNNTGDTSQNQTQGQAQAAIAGAVSGSNSNASSNSGAAAIGITANRNANQNSNKAYGGQAYSGASADNKNANVSANDLNNRSINRLNNDINNTNKVSNDTAVRANVSNDTDASSRNRNNVSADNQVANNADNSSANANNTSISNHETYEAWAVSYSSIGLANLPAGVCQGGSTTASAGGFDGLIGGNLGFGKSGIDEQCTLRENIRLVALLSEVSPRLAQMLPNAVVQLRGFELYAPGADVNPKCIQWISKGKMAKAERKGCFANRD